MVMMISGFVNTAVAMGSVSELGGLMRRDRVSAGAGGWAGTGRRVRFIDQGLLAFQRAGKAGLKV